LANEDAAVKRELVSVTPSRPGVPVLTANWDDSTYRPARPMPVRNVMFKGADIDAEGAGLS
jgi:hypothetical protein